jgi:hypothetical protein
MNDPQNKQIYRFYYTGKWRCKFEIQHHDHVYQKEGIERMACTTANTKHTEIKHTVQHSNRHTTLVGHAKSFIKIK